MSLSSFLSLQLSLASLLACLSLPSPVTLEGFNHQLNVTPYLRSAYQNSRTHTSTCTLPPCWLVILHFQQLFFPCKQLERHTWQDWGASHMQTAKLCLHKLCVLALLITLIKYGINIYVYLSVEPLGLPLSPGWGWVAARCRADASLVFLKQHRLAARQPVSKRTDRRNWGELREDMKQAFYLKKELL